MLQHTFAICMQVVAVPYQTSFDHSHITDSLQLKMGQVMRTLGPETRDLPVYGMGHSLGAVLTLLLNARFGVHRDGNVLLSFNNRPATDVIPFLSPLLAPGTRVLGPVLSAVCAFAPAMMSASFLEKRRVCQSAV